MRDLICQIERAIQARSYYLALYVTLMLPDICGAMESDDGLSKRARFVKWFEKYVAPAYTAYGQRTLTGEVCYAYRCAVLHQGRAQHPNLGFSRILFVEPGATTNVFHNNVLNGALNIDVSIFCTDVLKGVEAWLLVAEQSPNYKKNYPLFMQRHPEGLAPFVLGIPVIG